MIRFSIVPGQADFAFLDTETSAELYLVTGPVLFQVQSRLKTAKFHEKLSRIVPRGRKSAASGTGAWGTTQNTSLRYIVTFELFRPSLLL